MSLSRFYVYILLSTLLISCQADFNPSLNHTYIRYFGNGYNTLPIDIEYLDDEGFLLLGTEVTHPLQDSNMVLIRTDKFGHVLWRISMGSSAHEAARDMVYTPSRIMVLGQRYNPQRKADFYLAGISLEGNIVLEKTFGQEAIDEQAVGIDQQIDGDFVMFGHTNAVREEVDEYDLISIKVNPNGIEKYVKKYGLQGISKTDVIDDFGVAIKSEVTNDVVWLGNIRRNVMEQSVRMVRVNPSSDIIRDEKYFSAERQIATALHQVIQGYFITGEAKNTNSIRIFVRLVDNELNQVWSKQIEATTNEIAYSIAQTSDRSLILAGKSVNPETQNEDMLLLALDADGKVKWRSYFGGSKPDRGVKAIPLRDGGYALFGAITFGNNSMMALIKTDASGKLKG